MAAEQQAAPAETAQERKRRMDRERIAAKRAATPPADRARARWLDDYLYRKHHREQRAEYDRRYYPTRPPRPSRARTDNEEA